MVKILEITLYKTFYIFSSPLYTFSKSTQTYKNEIPDLAKLNFDSLEIKVISPSHFNRKLRSSHVKYTKG